MSWRDRYVQGSYRGVKFWTRDATTTIGQRKAVYEHPFSNDGVTALALGRRARRFSITALLVGEDYDRDRDKLTEAIEKPGPGLLVHPYLGQVLVEIDSNVSIRESTDQGGMAEFSFDAQETRGGPAAPTASPDTGAHLASRSEAVRASAKVAMERDLSLKDIRDYAASANLKTLDKVVTDLRELNGTISTALAVPARFAQQVQDIAEQTVRLIQAPGELVGTLNDAMAKVFSSVALVASTTADEVAPTSDTAEALDAVRASVRGFGAALTLGPSLGATAGFEGNPGTGAVTGDPPISAQNAAQRRNHAAILHNSRALALSHLADVSAVQTYDSAQDARAARDQLTEALEMASASVIAGFENDPTVLDSLQDLRAAVYAHLSSLDLDQLAELYLMDVTSSLTLAYELYADATRAEEIEARNNQAHPGFLTGKLEVLSD